MEQRLARNEVTQIFNLPYRRVALGKAPDSTTTSQLFQPPQIANLRYGRM
jgi:hypothetical protein